VQVVEAGVLTNLPYANNTFDLVFSADVLEHIHEGEADAVVQELVRVSRRHLFLSISLKPHTKVRQQASQSQSAVRCAIAGARVLWLRRQSLEDL
jgi:ubiquinone/menaquinone biosynthesis C-methylase UbiE